MSPAAALVEKAPTSRYPKNVFGVPRLQFPIEPENFPVARLPGYRGFSTSVRQMEKFEKPFWTTVLFYFPRKNNINSETDMIILKIILVV